MDTAPTPLASRPRAPAPRSANRRHAPRPVPVRHDEYAHLDLEGLRACRTALSSEESQVSYWRRILQARLDVVRAGSSGTLDHERLAPVLTDARVSSGRRALVEVLAVDDIPPLPRLSELWDRRVATGDAEGRATLQTDLLDAEQQLSAYRTALHVRIADVTEELIARYRDQPSLCLTALPLPPARHNRPA